jgi:hypothetical protein
MIKNHLSLGSPSFDDFRSSELFHHDLGNHFYFGHATSRGTIFTSIPITMHDCVAVSMLQSSCTMINPIPTNEDFRMISFREFPKSAIGHFQVSYQSELPCYMPNYSTVYKIGQASNSLETIHLENKF